MKKSGNDVSSTSLPLFVYNTAASECFEGNPDRSDHDNNAANLQKKKWNILVSFLDVAVIMNLYPEFELERVQQLLPIRQVTGGDWDD